MATSVICAAVHSVAPLSSSSHTPSLKSVAPLAAPNTQQVQNGYLNVRASSSPVHVSRREAMTVAGGAGLAGLLLLVPVGSAEARNTKPETRKKIREELDKLKEAVEKTPEVIKQGVAKVAKK